MSKIRVILYLTTFVSLVSCNTVNFEKFSYTAGMMQFYFFGIHTWSWSLTSEEEDGEISRIISKDDYSRHNADGGKKSDRVNYYFEKSGFDCLSEEIDKTNGLISMLQDYDPFNDLIEYKVDIYFTPPHNFIYAEYTTKNNLHLVHYVDYKLCEKMYQSLKRAYFDMMHEIFHVYLRKIGYKKHISRVTDEYWATRFETCSFVQFEGFTGLKFDESDLTDEEVESLRQGKKIRDYTFPLYNARLLVAYELISLNESTSVNKNSPNIARVVEWCQHFPK